MATGFKSMLQPVKAPVRKYEEKDESVQRNVAGVMSAGGPLMKIAETQGLQRANARGLLNSSMAVGAAQDEVIKAATPIGAQEAQQNFQRNENERQYGRQTESEIRSINNQRDLQDDAQGFSGLQADRDRALTVGEAAKDRAMTTGEAAKDRAQRETLDREQRNLQERIANMNLDAADREGVARSLVSYAQTYAQQFSSIMSNTAMNAADREAAIKGLQFDRDNGIALTEQAYGVKIDFSAGGAPAGGGLSPERLADLRTKASSNPSRAVRDQAAKLLREAGY